MAAIIKIDVDGVIRDIFTPMLEIYNSNFNTNLVLEDIFDYDVEKVFTKVKEFYSVSAADWFFDVNGRSLFLYSNPYEGVAKAINKLRENGHKVVIVTWQPSLENKVNTLKFLEKNNIQYDDICFTRDKWMIESDYLIDDNPEFLLDLRDNSCKIAIDFPYNRHVNDYVIRRYNLMEAVDFILDEEEKWNYT